MTVADLMTFAISFLSPITTDAEFEAKELLGKALAVEKSRLAFMLREPVSRCQQKTLKKLLHKRRRGEPLQYIIGQWSFYNIEVLVGSGVLIPRQDTEVLVEFLLQRAGAITAPVIVDLCAGSGAIAISAAKNLPNATVLAVEKSRQAFSYLKRNIVLNSCAVQPVLANAKAFALERDGRADFVTCNPPYIPHAELKTLSREVRREPKMALDGGADGLSFYRAIARHAAVHLLKSHGMLIFEVGRGQAVDVMENLAVLGYGNIGSLKDLNGIDRVVYGQLRQYHY